MDNVAIIICQIFTANVDQMVAFWTSTPCKMFLLTNRRTLLSPSSQWLNWFKWMLRQVPPKRWNKCAWPKTKKTIIWTLPWLLTAAEKMAESVQGSVSPAAGQAKGRSQAGQRPGDWRVLGQVLECRRGARTTWRLRQPAGLRTLLAKPSRRGPYEAFPLQGKYTL
jgi:hypothetical protein